MFHYLTYEGSVDISQIDDQIEREAIESTIANFGQCPSQLWDKPHPARFESSLRYFFEISYKFLVNFLNILFYISLS